MITNNDYIRLFTTDDMPHKKQGITYADYLINLGFRFHPETVVIDASEINKFNMQDAPYVDMRSDTFNDDLMASSENFVDKKYYEAIAIPTPTIPMFNYMFIEYGPGVEPSPPFYQGMYIEMLKFSEHREARCALFANIGRDNPPIVIDKGILIWWHLDGILYPYSDMRYGNFIEHEEALPPSLVPPIPLSYYAKNNMHNMQRWRGAASTLITAMQFMHQKHPVELVTYKRQRRRYIKRKTGKNPSPYFLLRIDPSKTETRIAYEEAPERNTHKKSNLPMHMVRGHFRHVNDHPIEHFNGTFWIPAHTRGNASNGKVDKGYRIVLPENDAS